MKVQKTVLKKVNVFLALILAANTFCFSQNISSEEDIHSLLQEYLSNDIELQKLTIELEKKELDLQETEINSGMSLSLSSGQMLLKKTDSGMKISVSPKATFSFPENNTSVSVTSEPVFVTGNADSSANSGGSSNSGGSANGGGSSNQKPFSLSNTGIKFSTDIVSNTNHEKEITRLKNERSYLEAKRSLNNRALSAEKDFYAELKSLLSKANEVLSAEQEVYTEELNVKTVKAQGYDESSANYRSAQFKLRSANRTLEEAKREFLRLKNTFAAKCNIQKADTEFEEAWKFLPSEIAEVAPVEFTSFEKENYTKIESAQWNQKIGSLLRETKNYSVKANAGYTFDNSNTDTNTIDAGIDFSYKGLTAEAGINVPVTKASDSTTKVLPALTMSFSYTPQTAKLENISEQKKLLEIKSEQLSMQTALEDYEKTLVSKKAELEDLLWTKESRYEELVQCIESEINMAKWYEKGIISEKDYLPEKVNVEKAKINCLMNAVDFIIYNGSIKLLFCND